MFGVFYRVRENNLVLEKLETWANSYNVPSWLLLVTLRCRNLKYMNAYAQVVLLTWLSYKSSL